MQFVREVARKQETSAQIAKLKQQECCGVSLQNSLELVFNFILHCVKNVLCYLQPTCFFSQSLILLELKPLMLCQLDDYVVLQLENGYCQRINVIV